MKNFFYLSALVCLILAVTGSNLNAQHWVNTEDNSPQDFYTIQKSFEDYWKDKNTEEKGKGWKAFKRWEWFWGQRVYPSGNFPNPDQTYLEYKKRTSKEKKNKTQVVGSWAILGPSSNSGGYGGMGRVNVVRELPGNSSVIFAGSAGGGLWETTNGGSSWFTTTDELGSIGITDIVFNPSNSNTMYIATGDGDAADNYSIGVMKSTDGGSTWNTTGLNWSLSNTRRISRLLIHPTDGNTIYAGTSSGIYKTTDGGTSWTLIFNSMSVKDMEFLTSDPNTIIAAGSAIYRTTNAGSTWSQITSGLPTSGVYRIALAVTPANSSYVYALMANNTNYGFLGLYRSVDGGVSWTRMSNSPNILGWNYTGNDTGGQGWYDLCIAASLTNANEIYTGGVNTWKSTNGGANWSIISYWNSQYSPTIHADQHDLWIAPNSTRMYSGNDGGVYRTTNAGTSWSWLGSGMQITQFYRLGASATNSSLVMTGSQDNGSKLRNGTTWTDVIGGDGMECLINHSNSSVMYGELYYGQIYKSTNTGASFSAINWPSERGSYAGWVAPYVMHPTDGNTLYMGCRNVFKTTNSGTSWSQLTNFTSGTLSVLHVAPSNANYIYASTGANYLQMTSNGGTSWNQYSLPVTLTLTYLSIHNTDPLKIWATFSGYSSGYKVYYSTNGGQSWTNVSGTLPNVPVNCIVYQNSYSNRVYVGTDIGVFYRDDNTTDWQDFNTNLPNVVVNELEIHYGTSKIRAATYGRGLWEAEIPVVQLTAPTLASPANQATGIVTNPTLSWNSVTGVTGYQVHYSTSSSFATYSEVNTTSTSTALSNLSYLTTYYWRARSTDGSSFSPWSTTNSFTTESIVLASPVLTAPDDLATNVPVNTTLSWSPVTNAASYVVQYSTSSTFGTYTERTSTTTSLSLTGLAYNTLYYWRVKAVNGGVTGGWSNRSFTTVQLTLSEPTLSSPSNGATGVSVSPNLSWLSVANATGYIIQYSTVSDFTTNTETTSTSTSKSLSGLSYSTTYYWRVKATNGSIQGPWSGARSFTTQALTLSVPSLVSPRNNARSIPTTTTLSWSSVTNATGYTIQYSTTSTFSSYTQVSSGTNSVGVSGLATSTSYYWRVKATNGSVSSAWSSSRKFTTRSGKDAEDSENLGITENNFEISPNPVTNTAELTIDLIEDSFVSISVYASDGTAVMDNHFGLISRGNNQLNLNLSNLANGVYIVVMKAGEQAISKKVVISR
jgi:photosystem II stability/assembly factor-like uncharacterized protein